MCNKLKWNIIHKFYRSPPVNPITRTKFTENKYKIFKFLIKKIFKTSNVEYIKNTIINPNISSRFILTNNDFEYNIDSNIKHLLLWVNPYHLENKNLYKLEIDMNTVDYLEKLILIKLSSKFPKEFEFSYFENSPNNRSIPEIKHIHIFVKFRVDISS
tara:strand:- start:23 stop:496 length:474 start_codon:yes stop_codon:yes gene_type:complete